MNFHGISGGPSYINNKTQWLESNGWKTYGFCGYLYGTGEVMYEGLRNLKKSLIEELTFCPNWFSTKRINNVIEGIKNKIEFNFDDEIVIESNSIVLAEWGETLGSSLKAKHIVYLIAENLKINDVDTFDFLSFKYKRNELFTISEKAAKNLFANFVDLEDAGSHFWDAMSSNKAEPIITKIFDDLPEHDWMITHFGRYKNYFNNLIPEIVSFAENNQSKKIAFCIVGDHYNRKEVILRFENLANLVVVFFDPMVPIPQKLFDISNVVISTAGCACISFRAGAKTISMDVDNNKPLGVLGYTTREHTFKNSEESNTESLEELLTQVLLENRFQSKPTLELNIDSRKFGYEYHISFVHNNDYTYYQGQLPSKAVGKQQQLDHFLVKKLGLVKIAVLIHINNHFRKK